MGYRVNLSLPRTAEIGRSNVLTLPIVDDAGATQTPGSGSTLTVRLGTLVLLDEVAVPAAAPAAYTMTAGTTTGQAPSAEYQEIWTLAGLGTFTWSGFLVRYAYYPTVTETHLLQRHPELLDLLPAGETTAEKYLIAAADQVQKALMKRGRRPWLVVDSWALHDAELYYALHLWAQDARMRTAGAPSNTYRELAAEYLQGFKDELGPNGVQFRYDDDEDGVVSADQVETPVASGVVLTGGPRRWRVA